MIDPDDLEQQILGACQRRGPDRSVCPSEVARAIDPQQWRSWMAPIRAAAARLVERGLLRVTRGGVPVPAESPGGPIRLQWIAPEPRGRTSVPGSE